MLSSTRVPRAKRARAYLPKKRPHQARAQATYDSILDAAARLLVERGDVDFTTNHIASLAGVAIGSLYEHGRRHRGEEAVTDEKVRCGGAEQVEPLARIRPLPQPR